jgi:hypothetical protein
MKTYARIDNGAVAELIETEAAPDTLFHPSLVWVEVAPPVAVGWLQSPGGFAAPPPVAAAPAPAPTLAELQAQLAALSAQLAALAAH